MKRITSFILFLLFVSFSQPILADDGWVGTCWVGTWATAVEPTTLKDMPAFSLANRSIRQVVHVSLGGSELRLQLSNVYSSVPVEITDIRSLRRTGTSKKPRLASMPASIRPILLPFGRTAAPSAISSPALQ